MSVSKLSLASIALSFSDIIVTDFRMPETLSRSLFFTNFRLKLGPDPSHSLQAPRSVWLRGSEAAFVLSATLRRVPQKTCDQQTTFADIFSGPKLCDFHLKGSVCLEKASFWHT